MLFTRLGGLSRSGARVGAGLAAKPAVFAMRQSAFHGLSLGAIPGDHAPWLARPAGASGGACFEIGAVWTLAGRAGLYFLLRIILQPMIGAAGPGDARGTPRS